MTTFPTAATTGHFERNLRAIAAKQPRFAQALSDAEPRADVEFIPAQVGGDRGVLSAVTQDWGLAGLTPRSLASKRDPIAEARRLADTVDIGAIPAVVVVGFGLGYHVAELARKMGRRGVVIVFEPDLPLLRTVLDRLDCADWIDSANVCFMHESADEGAMAEAVSGLEGLLALGVKVVEHPASKPRLGEQGTEFVARFTKVMKAVRTTVVTTMVQTEATLRNLLQNLDHYAIGPGIAELAGIGEGKPAVVVSAGPSLARNIDQLARPGVRDRFVIIAVQTALKPLLARGIRPHYVTALDFHEISARFYEGLTAANVEGIDLVVEPKVNPAVPAAFPGVVRCAADAFLDSVLGDLATPKGRIAPGATVAHLAYALARHLRCDPVVLIGQDLGFTDGQYYAAGAAIHNVWGGELNAFNTLEMLEWQRIVRMRSQLRRETDQLGRPIYTDEQMATYLVQFQRDFKADAARGLTVIDATEGGVRKSSTRTATLRETIDAELARPLPPESAGWNTARAALTPLPRAPGRPSDRSKMRTVIERLRDLRRDVWNIAKRSRETLVLLQEMAEHQRDQARVNRLISAVERLRDEVTSLEPAFTLVETINQTGVFNRVKADRRINLDAGLTPMEVQRLQIERDVTNVTWLADAATALGTMLEDASRTCAGGERKTRDPAPRELEEPPAPDAIEVRAQHCWGVVTFDHEFDGLGRPRDGTAPLVSGQTALALTLARLARTRRTQGVVLLTRDTQAARRAIGKPPDGLRLDLEAVTDPHPGLPPAVRRAARSWAAPCWRGGLGNLTCYDEALWCNPTAAALRRRGAGGALVVGSDWGLIDPALCDAIIDRYRERPSAHRLTFSQSPPGLAGCVVDLALLEQVAEKRAEAGSFASIGGILGYVPTMPTFDMIARPMCVTIDPTIRDSGRRFILDGEPHALLGTLLGAGLDPLTATAAETAAAATTDQTAAARLAEPAELILPLFDADGRPLDAALLTTLLRREDLAGHSLTLCATADQPPPCAHRATPGAFPPDTLDHPAWAKLARAAADAGAAVHLRTTLLPAEARTTPASPDFVEEILSAPLSVVSVDLIADDAARYATLTGRDAFRRVRETLGRLMLARPAPGPDGLRLPWVVPRLTRQDAVYEQIESWFDHWLLIAGWAVIDAASAPNPGDRIAPLPLPPAAAGRRARLTKVLRP